MSVSDLIESPPGGDHRHPFFEPLANGCLALGVLGILGILGVLAILSPKGVTCPGACPQKPKFLAFLVTWFLPVFFVSSPIVCCDVEARKTWR